MAAPDNGGPFQGVRVLDLSRVLSGPYCTALMGDLGADVIKVEAPGTGDDARSLGPFRDGESIYFAILNRGKRSLVLDLKQDRDRQLLLRLAAEVDVLVENFRPGVAAHLGADYETLSPANPRLIYASISGFGQTGPYSAYPGYDLIAQAMTGIMSVMGEPGGVPVKSSIPVADLGSGLFCAIGILAALIARGDDADGQYVETSLFEAALAMSVWESTEYWSTGESPQPLGSANRMSAPYQALATKDGYLTIGANNEKLWRKLCDVLGVPELETDPRFADNNLRMANRAELIPELERHFVLRSTDEWVVALLAEGVPAGPIRSYADVLTTDPHVKAREMIASFEHPVEGTTLVLASPLRLSGTPVTVRRPPPLLGEHNDEVFAEMSSSQAETRAEET